MSSTGRAQISNDNQAVEGDEPLTPEELALVTARVKAKIKAAKLPTIKNGLRIPEEIETLIIEINETEPLDMKTIAGLLGTSPTNVANVISRYYDDEDSDQATYDNETACDLHLAALTAAHPGQQYQDDPRAANEYQVRGNDGGMIPNMGNFHRAREIAPYGSLAA